MDEVLKQIFDIEQRAAVMVESLPMMARVAAPQSVVEAERLVKELTALRQKVGGMISDNQKQ